LTLPRSFWGGMPCSSCMFFAAAPPAASTSVPHRTSRTDFAATMRAAPRPRATARRGCCFTRKPLRPAPRRSGAKVTTRRATGARNSRRCWPRDVDGPPDCLVSAVAWATGRWFESTRPDHNSRKPHGKQAVRLSFCPARTHRGKPAWHDAEGSGIPGWPECSPRGSDNGAQWGAMPGGLTNLESS